MPKLDLIRLFVYFVVFAMSFIFYNTLNTLVTDENIIRAFWTILMATGGDAIRIIYKWISQNLKSEANILASHLASVSDNVGVLKNNMTEYMKESSIRLASLESRVDMNENTMRNIEVFSSTFGEEVKAEMRKLTSDVQTMRQETLKGFKLIDDKFDRQRQVDVDKKEFKQKLDSHWENVRLDIVKKFNSDLESFCSLVYHELEEFIISIHKYDFQDVDYNAFKSNHRATLDKIKALSASNVVDNEFVDRFFDYISGNIESFEKSCKHNFETRKLNSKKDIFQNDAERYLMRLMDCAAVMYDGYRREI